MLISANLSSVVVTATTPGFLKDETYFPNFDVIVRVQYSFKIRAVYGANMDSAFVAFDPVQSMHNYAHDMPSPPSTSRTCTHDELGSFVAPCNPSTLLPYSLALVFQYPTNDGFGTDNRAALNILPILLYDLEISDSQNFSVIVRQWHNLDLGRHHSRL